jgi:hypothetical protein
MKALTIVGLVAGFALLASLGVTAVLRNGNVELPPGLFYLPPLLAGLLGGVIAIVHEVGFAARFQRGDFEPPSKAAASDRRLPRIDRLWFWTIFAAWNAITAYLWSELKQRDTEGMVATFFSLTGGIILTLYIVGIPLRIVQNLIFKERRRQRLLETMMCIIAFIIMTSVFVMAVRSYVPHR